MLLRSITKHVAAQNWFAVVIDLMIVVVGVFIGIQVSNWNDERGDAQDSEEFTERLRNDLAYEAWLFEYVVEYYDDVLANAIKIDDALAGRKSLTDKELLIAAYRATQFFLVIRERSTYDELVSTGRIELIKNAQLRDTAGRVYEMTVYDLFERIGDQSPYRTEFRKTVAVPIQVAIANSCGDKFVPFRDRDAIVDSLDYPCDPDIDPAATEREAARLRADEDLQEKLRLRTVQLHTIIRTMTYDNQDIRRDLTEIANSSISANP